MPLAKKLCVFHKLVIYKMVSNFVMMSCFKLKLTTTHLFLLSFLDNILGGGLAQRNIFLGGGLAGRPPLPRQPAEKKIPG